LPDPGRDIVDASTVRDFLTLRVDERCYALRAEDVREIMRVPAMTRVPQSPGALLGIANLRGAVVPVASLRGLLGMTEAPLSEAARAIVLDVGMPVAVAVDAVDALVTVASDRVQTAQTELGEEPGERLQGLVQTGADAHAAKILDIALLLDTAFTQRKHVEHRARRAVVPEAVEDRAVVAANLEMLVTFDVAGQEFAVDLSAVQEILPVPATRGTVPRAEAVVLGVTSLRGALLPLLSMRALLGFPPAAAASGREKVVVMNVAGAHVGLVVDHTRAIVAAEPDLIDPVPAALAARMGGESRIRGIYRGEGGRRLISILAPEQLFREDVIQRLSAQARESGMPTMQGAASPTKELSLVVFRLGSDEFALPIDVVQEIAPVPARIRRVPKTPKFLEGVINLRGAVLPVIDQRRRFDMPHAEHAKGRRLVVVQTERLRAGLIVDSVSDVLRISAVAVEPAPELTDDITKLVRGVINLAQSGRIVLLLDSSELLTRAERGMLDRFQAESAQASA
jgi:purine-binding chemotaxis protein CheW